MSEDAFEMEIPIHQHRSIFPRNEEKWWYKLAEETIYSMQFATSFPYIITRVIKQSSNSKYNILQGGNILVSLSSKWNKYSFQLLVWNKFNAFFIIINCNHIFNEKTLSISELILLNLLSFHHCQMIASKMKWEQLRPFRNHIVFYHIFYNIPARILQYLKIFDLFLFMKPNIFLQWFQKVDKQTSWVWCVHKRLIPYTAHSNNNLLI